MVDWTLAAEGQLGDTRGIANRCKVPMEVSYFLCSLM